MTRPLRFAVLVTAAVVFWVASSIFAERLTGPTPEDQITTKLVCQMISKYHISQHPIDDEISRKLLDRYLKDLDPQKLYFLRSDVQAMERYRTELDDLLKAGDVRFGFDTFNLYLKRLNEMTDLAHRLIDRDYDFTVDETMVTDPDQLSWAADRDELAERWRKRIKYELLLRKLDGSSLDEARKELHKRYDNIRSMMNQTESFEVLEMYLTALTHCFDPHSSYMSPQSVEEFRIAMELSLEGIGAALRWKDGYTVVAEIIPGGAADADGRLKVGDKIIAVAQGDEDFVDVVGMKLTKVVRLIRGPRGTVVRLRVQKGETGKIEEYALTRQKIELHEQEVKGEILPKKRTGGLRIGVVNIPSFYHDFRGEQSGDENYKSAARDLRRVLEELQKDEPLDGLIVDLRYNGGGALSEAIEISGLFIDEGPVVQVKDERGRVKAHYDPLPGVAYDGPMVLITNRLSASASEIFAGAMKDYHRAIIVGDTTTHGKGTVQNVMPVTHQIFRFFDRQDRGALKLTIQQFYRVNGDSTQNRGVHSDIVLPSRLDHSDVGEAFLDNALAFDQIEPIAHYSAGLVNDEMINGLRAASQARVKADPEFRELEEKIAKYLERKNRKTVSLREDVLKKEHEELLEEEKEQEEEQPPPPDKHEPIFPDDYYNNEVLRITLDYVSLLKNGRLAASK